MNKYKEVSGFLLKERRIHSTNPLSTTKASDS